MLTKLDSVPKRAGYTFCGYARTPNGYNMYYGKNGTPIISRLNGRTRKWSIANNVTLYAVWKLDPSSITSTRLSDGQSAMTSGTSAWFNCTISGATDFSITSGSSNTEITIYKYDPLTSKYEKLYNEKIGAVDITLDNRKKNSGTSTYYVNVESSSRASISCKVNAHVDVEAGKISKGKVWVSDDSKAGADKSKQEIRMYYATKEQIYTLRKIVEKSSKNYWDTIEVAARDYYIYSLNSWIGLGAVVGAVLSTIIPQDSDFTYLALESSLSEKILHKIDDYTGYKELDNSGHWKADRGCLLVLYENHIEGKGKQLCYYLQEWNEENMHGADGFRGEFSAYK